MTKLPCTVIERISGAGRGVEEIEVLDELVQVAVASLVVELEVRVLSPTKAVVTAGSITIDPPMATSEPIPETGSVCVADIMCVPTENCTRRENVPSGPALPEATATPSEKSTILANGIAIPEMVTHPLFPTSVELIAGGVGGVGMAPEEVVRVPDQGRAIPMFCPPERRPFEDVRRINQGSDIWLGGAMAMYVFGYRARVNEKSPRASVFRIPEINRREARVAVEFRLNERF